MLSIDSEQVPLDERHQEEQLVWCLKRRLQADQKRVICFEENLSFAFDLLILLLLNNVELAESFKREYFLGVFLLYKINLAS